MAVSFQLLRSSTASKRPTASNLAAGELGLNFNDDTSGLFYENASGNIMKVGPAEVGATAPNASPASGGSSGNSKGELWYDSGNSILKVYDGSSFVASADVTTITGVTAGTVSASKAVIVDSNKDITGFRNVTATGDVTIPEGDLILGSTAVTSTAAEINVLDGVTAGTVTASKALVVDSNKDLASLRNLTLTGDLTVPEGDLILGSTAVTSTAAELNTLDGVTAGTVTASKALVVDADKDLSGIRTLTLEGWLIAPILDISGNVDIDGITNLDAVDIDGNVNLAGNLTLSGGSTNVVLTDNTAGALDIKEGATSYFKFDTTNGSELITAAKPVTFSDDVTIPEGDLILGSAAVTSTAAELNLLDGVTAGTVTASKALVVDANKDLASLRNLTLTGDLTVPEGDLILGSTAVTSTAAELNLVDGITAGTVSASKAVIVDADKDITGFRNITLTGELDVATLDVSSTSDFAGDVTFSTAQDISVIDNSGLALRIMESTNEYLRIVTTDGSESVTIKKTLETDGDLQIDGGVTMPVATDIGIVDNSGLALRVMEGTNEYVRFTTTDGSELVDFTKSVKLDGGVDIAGPMTITGDIDCTLDSGTSNALDFVISGGNRMMRFNTNTETVLLEQNLEVDGEAQFDGAMDINSTMDISGGDITLSANCDVHIPDNSAQALDIAEGANNYVRFITTDDAEKIEVSQDLDINNDITYSGGDITFDGSNQQAFFPSNSQYALEMRTTASPFLTFDTRSAHPTLNITAPVGFQLTSTTPTMANSQMTIQLTNDTTLQFTVKGSDGTSRTATLTLS